MKILFITCSRLGDAVLTTNILRHFVATYPDASYTIVSNDLAGSIFKYVPNLDRLIKVEKQSFKRHWLKIWWQCLFTKWDIVLDMRDSIVSRAVLSRKTYVKKDLPDLHKVEENARAIGVSRELLPKIWLNDDVYQKTAQYAPYDQAYICIAPTASWRGKQWPAAYFGELMQKMMDPKSGFLPKMPIVILGGPGERERIIDLFEQLKAFDVLDRVGIFEPIESAAVISKAKFFIGNDSGLMHIAWTLGVKTFALFGPGFPDRYGPLGAHSHIIETDLPSEILRAQEKNAKNGKEKIQESLLASLPVEKLFKVIKEAL